uniref:Kringle domain-containing protein n=1 Tax=Mesocestoides corti TaxID=53468 RepID=A0A5K3FMK0_MESCO
MEIGITRPLSTAENATVATEAVTRSLLPLAAVVHGRAATASNRKPGGHNLVTESSRDGTTTAVELVVKWTNIGPQDHC